ncbi:hypothetical protein JHK87_015780 [Glycine soja]|nr:hypothetical protein JHK87_015780 [Glycine soja]
MRRRCRPPASLRRSPSTILETHDSCDGDDWRPVVAGSPSKTLPARGTTLKGKLLRSGYGSTDVVYNNQCLKGKVYYVVDRQRLPLNGWSTTSLLLKATTSKGTLLRRFQGRNVVECMALTSCLGEERRGMHGYYAVSRRRPPYDDTNPEAEKKEYIDHIEESVQWMGWKPFKITYTSDYFQELYELAVELIKKGHAYVDHQTPDEIKEHREKKLNSPWRDRPISESLKLFEDMKNGSIEEGKATLRMKQDMQSDNYNMYDLIAYRIKASTQLHFFIAQISRKIMIDFL